MAKGIRTGQKIKDEVLSSIKNNGLKVTEAAMKYDVGTKAIYRWLKSEIGGERTEISYQLEINKLKREMDQLYNILGKLTAEAKIPKKSPS